MTRGLTTDNRIDAIAVVVIWSIGLKLWAVDSLHICIYRPMSVHDSVRHHCFPSCITMKAIDQNEKMLFTHKLSCCTPWNSALENAISEMHVRPLHAEIASLNSCTTSLDAAKTQCMVFNPRSSLLLCVRTGD